MAIETPRTRGPGPEACKSSFFYKFAVCVLTGSANYQEVINNYNLFFRFIDLHLPSGFTEIDQTSSVLQSIEDMTVANNQFFFIADLIQLKILYSSRRSYELLGVEPKKLDPSTFFTSTHPDDLTRHNIARTKLFNHAQQLFIDNKGIAIITTNFRFRNSANGYTNTLVQCYLFFSEIPYKTVFLLQVCTDISWFRKIQHGYHYYFGNDLSLFRYPDEKILMKGNIFTKSQFSILQLLAEGLNSEQIADKLFLSIHTVNTHRRNILRKTEKSTTNELILDLKARGML